MEVLNTLISLQEIDSQIIHLKHQLEFLPSEIKRFDKLIEDLNKQFENEKKKLTSLEKRKKDKEREIEDFHEKIKKLKEKTSQVKTNKEYQALLSEIETVEENLKKEEENLLLILYEYDEIKKIISNLEKEFDERKKEIELQKKDIDETTKLINQKIETLLDSRGKIIKDLPKEYYDEYRELMKKHKGLAVVEVKNSVCQGCFLHIPPQLFVEIKLNQSIHHCPQCGRILFYRKEKIEEEKVSTE